MSALNSDTPSDNPYSVSPGSFFELTRVFQWRILNYVLLALLATIVAIVESAAQLRWHPISSNLLGFYRGYPLMIATLLPPAYVEVFCRRSKRFNNFLLSILGSAMRIILLYGVILFLVVNVAFYLMTGELMFTVTYPYDRTSIPAYSIAIGYIAAPIFFIIYDCVCERFGKQAATDAAGTKP